MSYPVRVGALAACLLLCPAARQGVAETRWIEVRQVGPFLCHAQFPLAAHRRLLESLAGLPGELQRELSLEFSGEPIHLHLMADRRAYRRHVEARVPGGSRRRALYLKAPGGARVFAYRHRGWERDVRHEAVHALLHNALPYLPLWLDEGLAEYFEESAPRRARGRHPHRHLLQWSLGHGWSPRLRKLEARRDFASIRNADYREAWAWVHFLRHGPPEAQRALADYLVAIRRGAPPGPFSDWLERRVPGAAARLTEHLGRLKR